MQKSEHAALERINADELLKDVTGAELEMATVAERVSEDLS